MPRSLNYLCISLFTESQVTCLGWINVYILFVLLAYLYIFISIVKTVNVYKRTTDFAANSFAQNSLLEVCLGSR